MLAEVAAGRNGLFLLGVGYIQKKNRRNTPSFFFYGFLENCTGLTRCGNLIVLEVFQSSGSVLWANYILKDRSLAHQQNNLSPYCCLDIRLGIQDQW